VRWHRATVSGTIRLRRAGVAELADARDLKSRGGFPRTGSIPVPGTSFSGTKLASPDALLVGSGTIFHDARVRDS
jgi:hypothetical protein